MPGVTITLLADRRTAGALDVARALASRIRSNAAGTVPVVLLVDPAFPARARSARRMAGEMVGPASVAALLGRMPAEGHAILVFRGPVRQQVVAALDRSSLTVLLTDGTVASLRTTQRTLRLLTELGYPIDRVVVAVVPGVPMGTLDPSAWRVALGRAVAHILPPELAGPEDAACYDALLAAIPGA